MHKLNFLKGLKYKLNLTPDFSFERYKNYLNKYDFGLATNSITQLTERQRRRRNILVENLLTFDRTFGEHKFQHWQVIPIKTADSATYKPMVKDYPRD